MIIQTFDVTAKGIGRKDYSRAIERSIQPFLTPTLRQTTFTATATWTVAVTIFPVAYASAVSMPQEDGSWDWLASSIPVHFFEVYVSIMTNHLVTVSLVRYNSVADYLAGIIAEWSPEIFGYGNANLTFHKGIPTQEGSLYAIRFGGWPTAATVEVTMGGSGIVTDLTLPWMD